MLRRMTYDDFMWWKCYEQVEPFGEVRDDFRAASVCAAAMNAALVGKTRTRFSANDFLLKFKEVEAEIAKTTTTKAAPRNSLGSYLKSVAKMHVAIDKAQRTKRQDARAKRKKS